MIREMTEGNLISRPQNRNQVHLSMNSSSDLQADAPNKKGANRLKTAENKDDGT